MQKATTVQNYSKDPQLDQHHSPTIERCPHDSENPYVMISRDLIRDSSISSDCYWLISYLLSHDKSWIINVQQIINLKKKGMGRDKVYSTINEAIEAGYMKRMEYHEKNLKRVKYFISETPKFKKCFRHPDFQDTENPHNKERTYLRKKKETYKEKKPKVLAESLPPSGALAGSSSLAYASSRKEPSEPIKDHKETDILEMTQTDSDSLPKLLSLERDYSGFFKPKVVARWISKFGSSRVLRNVIYFFQALKKKLIRNSEAWMEKALKQDYAAKESNIAFNRQLALEFQKKNNSTFQLTKQYLIDSVRGIDISFSLPPQQFKQILQGKF